jgi:hypothetical protein
VPARCRGQRVAGHVDRHAMTAGQAVQDALGVMARAGAYVEQPRRARSAGLLGRGGERGRHDAKPARLEEDTASLDHVAVIAFVPEAPLTGVESHAAMARNVETMPEPAHEAPALRAKRSATVRTSEHGRGAFERRRERIGTTSASGRRPAAAHGHHGNTSRVGSA